MDINIYDQYFQISDSANILAQFGGTEDATLLVILPDHDEYMDLIQKILAAINIQDLNEVKWLKLKADDGISLLSHTKGTKVNRILSFGFPNTQLGIHVEHKPYQLIKIQGIEMIISAPMDIVSSSSDHKKALWGALKQWA